jgi:hypothetical protein
MVKASKRRKRMKPRFVLAIPLALSFGLAGIAYAANEGTPPATPGGAVTSPDTGTSDASKKSSEPRKRKHKKRHKSGAANSGATSDTQQGSAGGGTGGSGMGTR